MKLFIVLFLAAGSSFALALKKLETFLFESPAPRSPD